MIRGRKPKLSKLRLIEGTHRVDRHGDRQRAAGEIARASTAFGPLIMPKSLRGSARKAWQRYIAPAGWLDGSRGAAAIAFCELWSELRRAPTQFPAAKHTQLRGYMADIGLTDERKRTVEVILEKDEHFDD